MYREAESDVILLNGNINKNVPNLTIKPPPAQQFPQVHLIEESSEIQRKRKRESEEVQCGLFHHFAPLFFSVSAG
ncbi:hypothetical protein ACLB2K_014500 [Fragaria x ananassa]